MISAKLRISKRPWMFRVAEMRWIQWPCSAPPLQDQQDCPGSRKNIFPFSISGDMWDPIPWRVSHNGWGLRCRGAIPVRTKSLVIMAPVTWPSRSSMNFLTIGRRASSWELTAFELAKLSAGAVGTRRCGLRLPTWAKYQFCLHSSQLGWILVSARGSDYRYCIAQSVNAGMDMVLVIK